MITRAVSYQVGGFREPRRNASGPADPSMNGAAFPGRAASHRLHLQQLNQSVAARQHAARARAVPAARAARAPCIAPARSPDPRRRWLAGISGRRPRARRRRPAALRSAGGCRCSSAALERPASAPGIGSIVASRYGLLRSSSVTRNFSMPLSTMLKRPSGSGSECVMTPAQPTGKIGGRPS